MKNLALIMLIVLAGCASPQFPSAQVVVCNLPDARVEIALVERPHRNLDRLVIRVRAGNEKADWNVALVKTNFADWNPEVCPTYYGISQFGPDIHLFTVSAGTGIGTYFIHTYRIKDGTVRPLKSQKIFEWALQLQEPFHQRFIEQIDRVLVPRHDTNDPWNVWLETTEMNSQKEFEGLKPEH